MSERRQEKLYYLASNWPIFTEVYGQYIHGSAPRRSVEYRAERLREALYNSLETLYTRYLGDSLFDDMLILGGDYVSKKLPELDNIKRASGIMSTIRTSEARIGTYYDRVYRILEDERVDLGLEAYAYAISGAIHEEVRDEIPVSLGRQSVAAQPAARFALQMYYQA